MPPSGRHQASVLRRLLPAWKLLTPGGIVVAVEPWSTDRFDDSIGNPIARLDYAISTSMCTPTSLARPGGYGLGTSGGPTRRLECSPARVSLTRGWRSTPGKIWCSPPAWPIDSAFARQQ